MRRVHGTVRSLMLLLAGSLGLLGRWNPGTASRNGTLMARPVERSQRTKAHSGGFPFCCGPSACGAGDENRTRMASLEDENREALARQFPYVQRKRLTLSSRE